MGRDIAAALPSLPAPRGDLRTAASCSGARTGGAPGPDPRRRRGHGIRRYLTRYEADWVCFDDAVPILRQLRGRGLRIGIFTKGERSHQELKLELVGLCEEVNLMITSSDLSVGEPYAKAYAEVVERLGVPADEITMVGDSLENDVLATDHGLHAVLLDRRYEYAEVPVPRIHTLDELAV